MLKNKFFALLSALIFIGGFLPSGAVLAADISSSSASSSLGAASSTSSVSVASTGDCEFQSYFDELNKVGADAYLDYQSSVVAELKIRQEALNAVLDCGLKDVANLKSQLEQEKISDSNSKAQLIQNQYLGQLQQANDFYNQEKARVSGLGILGTKQLAAEILNWKQNTYDSQSEKIVDFILWLRNQKFIGIVQQRLNAFSHYLNTWNLMDNPEIQSSFSDAQKNFQSAQDLNTRIGNDFYNQNFNLPDMTQSIKISLESVSAAYQNFFDLQKEIQKILP
jgi:hypothetical protein